MFTPPQIFVSSLNILQLLSLSIDMFISVGKLIVILHVFLKIPDVEFMHCFVFEGLLSHIRTKFYYMSMLTKINIPKLKLNKVAFSLCRAGYINQILPPDQPDQNGSSNKALS